MERKKLKKTNWQNFIDFLNYDPWASGQRTSMFETLVLMLTSGIELKIALKELKEEAKTKYLQNLIEDMQNEIENGTPLWRLIEYHRLVPNYYIELIRIGEQKGVLLANLNVISAQIEKDKDFKSRVKTFSLYPIIIFSVLVIVTFLIFVYVVSKVANVYYGLNVDLPLVTKILLDVGVFIGNNSSALVIAYLVCLLLLIAGFIFSKRINRLIKRMLFKIPVTGKLFRDIELARMGETLSSLINANIGLLDALHILQKSAEIKPYAKFYSYLGFYLEKGYTLQLILNSYSGLDKILPVFPKQLLIAGERSGKLGENLQKISVIYAKKVELAFKDFSTLFEPVVLLLIWVGVTVLAVAVIMPIYSVLNGVTEVSQQNVINQPPEYTNQTGKNSTLNNNLDSLTNLGK